MITTFPALAQTAIETDDRASWRARAVAAYRGTDPRTALAARLHLLLDQTIPLSTIYVDPTTGTATVSVDTHDTHDPHDNVIFRLRHDTLMIVRACTYCGVRQFESPPIESLVDLGYALDEWEPHCEDCSPEDSPDWSSW